MLTTWIKKFGINEGEIFLLSGFGDVKFKVVENILLQGDEDDWELCSAPVNEISRRVPTTCKRGIKFSRMASYAWLQDYCKEHTIGSISDTDEPVGVEGTFFARFEPAEDFFYGDYNRWDGLRLIECTVDDEILIFGRN